MMTLEIVEMTGVPIATPKTLDRVTVVRATPASKVEAVVAETLELTVVAKAVEVRELSNRTDATPATWIQPKLPLTRATPVPDDVVGLMNTPAM
jgi:hypothetical protein